MYDESPHFHLIKGRLPIRPNILNHWLSCCLGKIPLNIVLAERLDHLDLLRMGKRRHGLEIEAMSIS